jgi:hypothetical protein
MIIENYRIYDFLEFQIRTNFNNIRPFNRNIEYEYFLCKKNKVSPSFIINSGFKNNLHNENQEYCYSSKVIKKKYNYTIKINGLYNDKTILDIDVDYKQWRHYFAAYVSKNLYVRSLITLHLLRNNSTLIHGGGITLKGKAILFAGRPGVFKTSLIMDSIRDYGAKYFGDENVLINNGKMYPFPLNLQSFIYKVNNYKTENAKNKIQKLALWGTLLLNAKQSKEIIAFPSKVKAIVYIEKGTSFEIKEIDRLEAYQALYFNEIEELNIAPTHSLSGIKYNDFYNHLLNYEKKHKGTFQYNFTEKFKTIVSNFVDNTKTYKVTVPKKYSKDLLCKILRTLKIE